MAQKQKQVPLTPDEVEALTTTQHIRRAQHAAEYWQKRSDAILKNPSPTPGQLESQPWFEQHSLIWAVIAEKLGQLDEYEREKRARTYQQSQHEAR